MRIHNLILDPEVEELEQEWQTEMPCKWWAEIILNWHWPKQCELL